MKRVAVLVLIMTTALPAATMPQGTLKVGVDLVNVLFNVTDRKGRFMPGLSKNDFLVEEDGRKQEIQFFSKENELPLTLGILIDISPSVRSVFDEERAAATRFLKTTLRPKDLAMIIDFEKSVTLTQDFTEDTHLLGDAIDSLELGPSIDGGTSLYDAIYLAAKDKLRQETGRKAIILISDGEDTTSKVDQTDAIVAVHQTDAVIYSIAISSGWRYLPGRGIGGGSGTLKRLADETGGTFFSIQDQKDFEKAFVRINEQLRNQYSLGYVSTNPEKDGKYRRIKIIPRDHSYKIQARKGYYAAKASNTQ